MNPQQEIDEIFESKAFERPLYYSYPGGLRFGLSETGTCIEQFLTALRKARVIARTCFQRRDRCLFACGLAPAPIRLPIDRSSQNCGRLASRYL